MNACSAGPARACFDRRAAGGVPVVAAIDAGPRQRKAAMAKPNTVFKEAYNGVLALLEAEAALPAETELAGRLGVSRTTVRAVLAALSAAGIIAWDRRAKAALRRPRPADYFPEGETDPTERIVERGVMRRILAGGLQAGDHIGEVELAREIGVGPSAVREFLIRFGRFGLIEKRRNSRWVLKGFTRGFALELAEVREMFELASARAFVRLPADHAAWTALAGIEAAHRALLSEIDVRPQGFAELDETFHRLIHQASANRFVMDFYDVIAMVFHYHYQWNKRDEAERNRVALLEHLDYIAALKGGDEAAVEAACRRHLASARATLLRSIPHVARSSA